jgi:HEPN domain-containing protein
MARQVKKHEARAYLKQAEEFLSSARDNLTNRRFNAAGFNAIQSIINANDALTIYFLERRASADHKEAIRLHIDVVRVISDSAQRETIKRALDMRSEAGYLGKPILEKKAAKLIKNAVSFIGWVKKYVKF